jgi:multidrug efflux pump subunit AcrB
VENIQRRLRLNVFFCATTLFKVDSTLRLSAQRRGARKFYCRSRVHAGVFPAGIGRFVFRPLALAYVLAILASMLVALTLTPALSPCCCRVARNRARRFRRRCNAGIGHFCHASLCGGCWRSAFWSALSSPPALPSQLGEEFLPNFKETDFLMHWVEKPGTSLDAMRRITERVSRELRAVPGVRNFGSHIGRAEVVDEVVGPNFTELWISIQPDADYDTTVHRIQEIVGGYPGLYRDAHLLEGAHQGSAHRRKALRSWSASSDRTWTYFARRQGEVAAVMEKVTGVTALKIEPQVLVPQVTVRLRPRGGGAIRFDAGPGAARGHDTPARREGR